MRRKLNCILLVDDDPDDNFYHQIIITEMDIAHKLDIVSNGIEALKYLKKENQTPPELIFLDINMPRMNGWEFLEEYKKLDAQAKASVVIMILTTSSNPDDIKKAKQIQDVSGIETKPLNKETLAEILQEHFPNHM